MKEKLGTLRALNRSLAAYDQSFYLWYGLEIVLGIALPIFQLYVTSYIINLLMMGVNFASFIRELSWPMIILIILQAVLTYSQGKYDLHGELYRNSLTGKVFHIRMTSDYPLLLGSAGAELFDSAYRSLDHSGEAVNMTITSSKNVIIAFIATLLYMGILSQLHLVFVIMIGLLVIILLALKHKQDQISRQIQPAKVANSSKYHYLNTMMGDQRIAKDVRLYSMSPWFMEIFQCLQEQYKQIIQPINRWRQIEGIIVISFLATMSALAYHFSIQEIQAGQLAVADFVVYVSLVTMATTTLTNLINNGSVFSQNLDKLKSLHDYFNQEQVLNHHSDLDLAQADLCIELQQVSYRYPNADKDVLKDLNLTIHPNEKLALVGLNGAGKTTLIKLIMGLIQPDQGQVLINGQSIDNYNIHEYYDLFAPVFQDDALFTLTLKDTILQGNEFDANKYQRVIEEAEIETLIDNLAQGEETPIIRQIDPEAVQLSGGQMQKLKLAKALYKDAPILVLDEPTAALDPLAESQVYQNYLSFAQDKTAIFISHRLASTQFCDRIIYLDQGQIIETGSHQELMQQKGKYYQLFETQAHYYREDYEEQAEIEVGGLMV